MFFFHCGWQNPGWRAASPSVLALFRSERLLVARRLRAGLCDRCSVTQDVAKRRQQEFEASQIQSLQHISILGIPLCLMNASLVVVSSHNPSSNPRLLRPSSAAGEMTNLKKEILKLKDENRALRAALKWVTMHETPKICFLSNFWILCFRLYWVGKLNYSKMKKKKEKKRQLYQLF